MQRTAFWRRLPTVKVAALVATLLLVLTLTIGPLRTVAADFLRLFRVERVTVLPVELDNMDGARFDSLAQQAQLMAESFEIEIVGESQEVSNAAEATDRLGYPVRLPADQTVDALNIEAGVSMHGTLDEAQLESLFYYAFENKLDLPSSIDGKPFKVVVPPMVRAELGEGCGDYRERARNGCVTLVQLGSPIAEFPDELPVLRLGELFLQLVGYDSAEARELARTIDWTSTLVVPIPSRDMESQSVTVDGVEGTLLTSESDSAAFHQRYALIWVREGKLYGLAGHGDPAPAIAMANSLR